MPPRSAEDAQAPPRVAGRCYVLLNLLFYFSASLCRVPSQGLGKPSLPSRAYLYKIVKEVKNILQKF